MSRESQENPQNELTWAHRHLQKRYRQPGSLYGSDLGLLHIRCSCVTWSSCETFYSESGGYLWLWYCLLGPIPPTELHKPALIQKELPTVNATWYIHGWLIFVGDLLVFEEKQWGQSGWGWWGTGKMKRRGNFVWDVKTNKQKRNQVPKCYTREPYLSVDSWND